MTESEISHTIHVQRKHFRDESQSSSEPIENQYWTNNKIRGADMIYGGSAKFPPGENNKCSSVYNTNNENAAPHLNSGLKQQMKTDFFQAPIGFQFQQHSHFDSSQQQLQSSQNLSNRLNIGNISNNNNNYYSDNNSNNNTNINAKKRVRHHAEHQSTDDCMESPLGSVMSCKYYESMVASLKVEKDIITQKKDEEILHLSKVCRVLSQKNSELENDFKKSLEDSKVIKRAIGILDQRNKDLNRDVQFRDDTIQRLSMRISELETANAMLTNRLSNFDCNANYQAPFDFPKPPPNIF